MLERSKIFDYTSKIWALFRISNQKFYSPTAHVHLNTTQVLSLPFRLSVKVFIIIQCKSLRSICLNLLADLKFLDLPHCSKESAVEEQWQFLLLKMFVVYFWGFLFIFLLGHTCRSQELLLALHTGITISRAQEIIWDASDWTQTGKE